jgi:hypothetical protein
MSVPMKVLIAVATMVAISGSAIVAMATPPPTVDAQLVDAILTYGQAHVDPSTGLVRDSVGEPNLAEHSQGYLAALLLKGGHQTEAIALLTAILDRQDTQEGSPTQGYFRWHGGENSPYSYDATLYAVPPLAWALRHFRSDLGHEAERLAEALQMAVVAISRDLVGPENESYLMLQAAARASAGAALDEPTWLSAAVGQVSSWLRLVKSQGLPQGHSPTFDALRIAALLWVRDATEQPSPELDETVRLALADVGTRIWAAGNRVAGAMYRSVTADYMPGGGVAAYALAGYFDLGTLDGAEPFAMYLLLPASKPLNVPPTLVLPYQTDTSSTGSDAVTTTSTFIAPEFTLGTMSGLLTAGSVPLMISLNSSDGGRLIHARSYPAVAGVNTIQHQSTALMSFDFDQIGVGSRRQAYVSLALGHSSDLDEIYVRGAPWNGEATGLGHQETLAVATGDCYVGVLVGRCGPANSTAETRVKPGHLDYSGEGAFRRLTLTLHGRQEEYALEQPIHDVRVVFAISVVPKTNYPSLEDFAADFGKARIRQDVQATRRTLGKADEQSQPRPIEGVVPKPQTRLRLPSKQVLQQTIELQIADSKLKLVEDLRTGELLERHVDGLELSPGQLWSAPGFEYRAGADLPQALSEAGY